MAYQVLQTVSRDEIERARLMSEYKFEVDNQSKMVQARRVGLLEGEQRKQTEFMSLLKSGKSPDEIIKMYEK